MNTQKQTRLENKNVPNTKLQKSSVIFMQLGLILALFSVYIFLEYKTYWKVPELTADEVASIDTEVYVSKFEIERKKPKITIVKTKTKVVKPVIDEFKTEKNNTKTEKKVIETVLIPIDDNDDNPTQQQLTVSDVSEQEDYVENNDPVDFIRLEDVPTFPGCKGTNEQKRKCFNKKIQKHIQRNFNVDLAQTLGLSEGKHRINIQFIINEQGEITGIRSTATHPRLKKEAERIIKKLPKFKPGLQRLKPVKVRYNVPISFNIEN